jgi:tRNA modification GTPase
MRNTKYDTNDTIVAVSSPSCEQRVIIRITGPRALDVCRQIHRTDSGAKAGLASCRGHLAHGSRPERPRYERQGRSHILSGSLAVDDELEIDALLYIFPAPRSYTGDGVVEIHAYTNPAATEALISNLLKRGLRMAEPGEFTARAYLNGKLDLAQAEAVNEIIVSSNEYQLAAAERLLQGRLGETTAKLRESLMELLGLLEAGLDFSQEDIEFISPDEAVKRLVATKDQLKRLLSSGISLESVIDLPSVGIAGAPNAGKSTLLNKLLGKERSIVSPRQKTTRDVLTGVWTPAHCRCVLFDCAGLLTNPADILDELAQQAAIEALRNSAVTIFCADVSKTQWSRDLAVRRLIEPKILVPVATKCDLLAEPILTERLAKLKDSFGVDFLPISAQAGTGIDLLRETIDRKLTGNFDVPRPSGVALTARHRQALAEAMGHVDESIDELKAGSDEVAAMMLRAAYQALCDIEQPGLAHIDEQILEQIFSRFCVGK